MLDTRVFDADRYFDALVEYAKSDPEDLLIRITVHNRGAAAATVHVLPTLWFRNIWSWTQGASRPSRRQLQDGVVLAAHSEPGDMKLEARLVR